MQESAVDGSLAARPQITELDTWPEDKDVPGHLAKCRASMGHLNEARKLLGEARSDHAGAKIIGLQQVPATSIHGWNHSFNFVHEMWNLAAPLAVQFILAHGV